MGTFRHPAAVVRSLAIRNEARALHVRPRGVWLTVWCEYNERLLAVRARRPFPTVVFDLPDEAYRAAVGRCCERLGLDGAGADLFFEPLLRANAVASDTPIEGIDADRAERLYARLREVAS